MGERKMINMYSENEKEDIFISSAVGRRKIKISV